MDLAAPAHRTVHRLDRALGGAHRRRVVVALASVLALDSADKATVGTSATQLQAALHIDHTQIGLLLAVGSVVGGVATLPFGVLVDRRSRTRLLAVAIVFWCAAMVLSGVATGFVFLLVARMALGAVTGVAAPAVASLIGDYFPQGDRARMYGFVLSGELIGAALGFVVTGQLAIASWRAPFFALVLPGALVCYLVARLPEPARGGQASDAGEADDETDLAHDAARRNSVAPRRSSVLDQDPRELSLLAIARYVLRVPTNVALVVASVLGYFFFSGLRGFAVEFTKQHYGLGQSIATSMIVVLGLGALAGVLVGGGVADGLLRRGRLTARPDVAGVAVLAATFAFVPALITRSVAVAIPILVLAALFLGATNPPLDAARLDIVHPATWGRAEAVRTALRNVGDGTSPLVFGLLADHAFAGANSLRNTFLVMLTALLAAAIVTLTVARRTYPADVAAAAESRDRATATERVG